MGLRVPDGGGGDDDVGVVVGELQEMAVGERAGPRPAIVTRSFV